MVKITANIIYILFFKNWHVLMPNIFKNLFMY